MGQVKYHFHLPFSYDLQILLARGNGASTNVEPCTSKVCPLPVYFSQVAVMSILF